MTRDIYALPLNRKRDGIHYTVIVSVLGWPFLHSTCRMVQLLQQVGGLFNGLISWEHIPFMLLYAWVLQWVSQTC